MEPWPKLTVRRQDMQNNLAKGTEKKQSDSKNTERKQCHEKPERRRNDKQC